MKPATRLNRFIKNMRKEGEKRHYCMTTDKRKFATQHDTEWFMDDKEMDGRAYLCGACQTWHITSQVEVPKKWQRKRKRR